MEKYNPELLSDLFLMLKSAPDGQMSKEVKKEVASFDFISKGDSERYDFLIYLSKKSLNEVSSFVIELCSLDKYYLRS
jgi:hypothetical protein